MNDESKTRQLDGEREAVLVINGLWSRCAETLKTWDAEQFAQWFTQDAILIEPNRPDIIGQEAIRPFAEGVFTSASVREVQAFPGETQVYQDSVYQFGTYREVIDVQGQPSVANRGRYLSVWSEWLIALGSSPVSWWAALSRKRSKYEMLNCAG